jgi:similar to stage IV sporulation protein
MVAEWIRLAGGMLTIRVRGAELERFLNICSEHRILLYRIRRTQLDELQAELSLRDFYRLSRVRKRSRCRVHILRRRGFPFFWKRIRHRHGLWIGLVLMGWLCWELSSRIWMIDLQLGQGVDSQIIMQELKQLHIDVGTRSTTIDAKDVKRHMMITLDELKYFSVNVEGNVLTVQAAAAKPPPEDETRQGIHDVVASKDGVIRKISVGRGTQLCKTGDAVVRGQMLVDALVEKQGELDEDRLTDANAQVWADVRYYVTRKLPLEASRKTEMGRKKHRYALCFGKTRINLYRSSSLTDGICDRIITMKTVRLNEHLVLPISLYCETVLSYQTEPVLLRAETMQKRLEYGTKRSVQAQLQEGCLTSMQADLNTEDHAAVLRSVVWCYEQIAERVESSRTELPPSTENKESEE